MGDPSQVDENMSAEAKTQTQPMQLESMQSTAQTFFEGAESDAAAANTTTTATATTTTTTNSRKRSASSSSEPAAVVTSTTKDGKPPPPTKKRPYRRTKRPKNYNDKSTITTTTESVASMNAYDAVLAESKDLLTAAMEAQQLGRLKMASAYLLLLHARIVGLGKRFDKARRPPKNDNNTTTRGLLLPPTKNLLQVNRVSSDGGGSNANDVITNPRAMEEDSALEITTTTAAEVMESVPAPSPAAAATPAAIPASSSSPASSLNSGASLETPKTKAARELAKMLPQNIELDTAMMEHLAKAAAELHAARSGRKKQQAEILKSPDAREFLANTANTLNVANAATTVGIAWSREEKGKLQEAMAKGYKDPKHIAEATGRSEQQVKAFIRNQNERKRVEADLELPAVDDTPKKKGGRGRKPATTAMNTVPNANCDTRFLLKGTVLESEGGDTK